MTQKNLKNNELEEHQWLWSEESIQQVYDIMDSSPEGISEKEAEQRLEIHGTNTLPETSKDSLFKIFIRQFKSPLLYILAIAALLAMILGEITDGIIIAIVLVLNGVIGTFQEGKAQDALFALREFTESTSLVMRAGEHHMINSDYLVPGDVVILREGDKIPADARIISAVDFSVNQSLLTGESVPVQKNADTMEHHKNRMVADQENMVFKGATVSQGTAEVLIVGTGIHTELGKISENVKNIETEIPLQTSIRNLSKIIIIVVTIVIAGLFGVGILLGNDPSEMMLVSIALMVSVIPEGLPVVMTLILAQGVKRMSGHNALVKRLQAVEALGQATIIAVDKTGTLTKNELSVKHIHMHHTTYDVTGSGYDKDGDILYHNQSVKNSDAIEHMTHLCALASGAKIFRNEDEVTYAGDPTEIALIVLGEKNNKHQKELLKEFPLMGRTPFNYEKKYLSTHVNDDGKRHQIFVGAPEAILEKSNTMWGADGNTSLTQKEIDAIKTKMEEYSKDGLRIIGVAERITELDDSEHQEGVWTFVGFLAMQDGLRAEVPEAMRAAKHAGVQVVMITGDHALTAQSIATEAGIFTKGDKVLSGEEIIEMTDDELVQALDGVTVFARVAPEHKMQIIQAYKKRGDIIAMTGDGVNDVPSLVAADLGVAMGKVGTEVAKDAADMVLLDDNFANISRAIEEGRHIFATLKKTLVYFFSTNIGELLVIVAAVLFLGVIPLIPAQIVWLNLVTDSFLVMTLAFMARDTAALSKRSSEKITRYILDGKTTIRLLFFGVIIAIGSLVVFLMYQQSGLELARTMTFLTLALFQIFRLWSIQSDTESVFTLNPFKQPLILGASFFAIGLQVFAIYTPFMQSVFETVPLSLAQWGIAIAVASSIVFLEEARKVVVRR